MLFLNFVAQDINQTKYNHKTKQNLCVWLDEHATNKGSAASNQMPDCANYQHEKAFIV